VIDPLTGDGCTVGVVGGGQLGRMLAAAASPLGVDVVVLDPTPDCPAATVASEQIVGEFDDAEALQELGAKADVLTVEIELVDPDLLALACEIASVPVHPSPDTLNYIQDKLQEKRLLSEHGVPVPAFQSVEGPEELRDAFEELGRPVMLKARKGGYDGRGNAPVESIEHATAQFGDLEGLIAEAFVDYERELSVMAANGAGETAVYPVVENTHAKEILRETIAPARLSSAVADRARGVAQDTLDLLAGRGIFGIELFETSEGEILVNEIAPRPHNSGHYTIEGATTSQFEQHIRAVLGVPLGSTTVPEETAMANILGDERDARRAELRGIESLLEEPGLHLHWYGKQQVRPLRKMGHLTATASADQADPPLERVRNGVEMLSFEAAPEEPGN